jgi:hemerythrin-like domain-containing protein
MPTASQVLLEEHQEIRAIVNPALEAGKDISQRGQAALGEHNAALSALAGLLMGDLSRHAAKEDEILFPAIEAALGSSEGPTAVMRAEHRGIHACGERYREVLAGLRLDGSVGAKASGQAQGPGAETPGVAPAAAQALAENLRELGDLIGVHFEKEEVILFPLAESLLPLEEQLALGARLKSYPS